MMHHKPSFAFPRAGDDDRAALPVSMMIYRSRAVVPPTELELKLLQRQSEARNRAESITGLLVYDQGCFYQWLEGPSTALSRVWESIRSDPRHCQVEVTREQYIPRRHFGNWNMRVAHRSATLSSSEISLEEKAALHSGSPTGSGTGAADWDQLLSQIVIPRLRRTHPVDSASPLLWHPRSDAVAELATLLRGIDPGAAAEFIRGLIDEGASLESLYQEVFEPTARFLGSLWYEDRCDEMEVTLSLGRLNFEARRVGERFEPLSCGCRPNHSVLVAPQPGEPHMLGAGMASELFWHAGWDVTCEFPRNNADLSELVHEHWFDVLDLSMSNALRHDHQLPAMSDSIRAAHAASVNPQLAIIVDGRVFAECPSSSLDVGADAGCVSVTDSVPAAERLVTAVAGRSVSRCA
jgi:hypothetical protein